MHSFRQGYQKLCQSFRCHLLYEQDVTTAFAGIVQVALQRFGLKTRHLHVDTTSFSVHGAYENENEYLIAITYGYSRDHREDLKKWMMALAPFGATAATKKAW